MSALSTMSAVEGLAGYLEDVEERLAAVVEAHPGTVAAVGSDALAAGGKRMRPALTFLSSRPGSPPPVTEGAAIELVHERAVAVDQLEDVKAFLVMSDFVGQLLTAAERLDRFALLRQLTTHAADDLRDLRVQVRDLLFGRVRPHDVDQFVRTFHCRLLVDCCHGRATEAQSTPRKPTESLLSGNEKLP